MGTVNELCRKIRKLRIEQDNLASQYTDDMGNWTQRKAQRRYSAIDRQVERLDAELVELDPSLADEGA